MATPNPFTLSYPTGAKAVTPSDTVVFPPSLIYCGGAGTITVMPADQAGVAAPAAVTFTATAGLVVPVMAIQVLNTGTLATSIVRSA